MVLEQKAYSFEIEALYTALLPKDWQCRARAFAIQLCSEPEYTLQTSNGPHDYALLQGLCGNDPTNLYVHS